MRRILLYTAMLAALFLALDRAVALLLSRALFPFVTSGEAGGDVNFLLQKRRDADFLVLGSSRARHQVDPALLPGALTAHPFNAGANGVGDVFHAGVVLDLALRAGLRPRTVLLQTDAWQFERGSADAKARRARALGALYPFLDESPLLAGYVREQAGFRERALLLLRAYRFNGKLPNLLAHRLRPDDPARDGFQPLEGSLAGTSPPRAKPLGGDLDPAALRALRNIADLCARHGVRLVVLLPPYYENRDGLNDSAKRAALRRAFREQRVERVVDFAEIPPALRSGRFWRDPAHLNREGAERFTRLLADSLTSPAAPPPITPRIEP